MHLARGSRAFFIALLAVLWFAGGVASNTHATFEALAHSGDELHAPSGSLDKLAAEASGDENAEHDHPDGTVCGPCHAHALKSSAVSAPHAKSAALLVRPSRWQMPVLDLQDGLFRPPRD